MARVLILGAGVFGRLARDEARRRGHEASCHGRSTPGLGVDADDEASVRAAIAATGAQALLHTAGPFRGRTPAAARAALDAGIPCTDLSDDGAFTDALLRLPEGVPLLPGMSTTPAVAWALARAVLDRAPGAAQVRCALYAAGGNRQGPATLAYAATARLPGRGEPVDFPGVGRRRAYPAATHPAPLPVPCRTVVAVGGLAALGWGSRWLATRAAPLGRFMPRVSRGTAGSFVADALDAEGRVLAREGLHAPRAGQRMAVLPALWALEEALAGRAPRRPAAPWAWVEPARLLEALRAQGFAREAR